jgi:tryptophan synthase alpha chain
VAALREESPVPVAVGFGIGTPEQAAAVGRIADGVIIGTRLVREVSEAADASAGSEAAGAFLRDVRAALAAG